ncbi:hypothetical protein VTN00DRAFT_1652 [Thermoascus crustaceus]|uniref:uncharacterized protein n=1 Tax=Thermoascus crustaceus TaxID=5088 RepID=UPI003742F86F
MARIRSQEAASDSDDSSTGSPSPQDRRATESEKKREKTSKEENVAESSDSSSESESETSSSPGSDSENDSDASSQKKDSTKRASPGASVPPEAFKPPAGFKAVKKQSPPSSDVSSLLSNLHGKQIYHVTAPSFLPLSSVKEISLAKIIRGQPVLTHQGVKYGIPADSLSQKESNKKTLLLYDEKSQAYYSVPAGEIKSYHVQEMISLPNGTATKEVPASIAQESSKGPKPQPKHLRMRFKPVGSADWAPETFGTSSEESEGEQPTFKFPKGSKAEREERERKRKQAEGDEKPLESPRKKSKKHSSQAESSQDHEERGRESKHKKSHRNRDETSQERKARKEEKKRKKAEKA